MQKGSTGFILYDTAPLYMDLVVYSIITGYITEQGEHFRLLQIAPFWHCPFVKCFLPPIPSSHIVPLSKCMQYYNVILVFFPMRCIFICWVQEAKRGINFNVLNLLSWHQCDCYSDVARIQSLKLFYHWATMSPQQSPLWTPSPYSTTLTEWP